MASTTSAHQPGSQASPSAGDAAKQTAKNVAGQADSPWLRRLGRIGVAVIGIVYLILAWIALQVAWGGSGESADNTGALQEVSQQPFGEVLLIAMSVGLFGFALWQVLLAVVGPPSDDGVIKRVSALAKAVFGISLGWQSLQIGLGSGGQSSSSKTSDYTATLMAAPAGRVLVVVAGLVVIGFAGYLALQGAKKKFLKKLEGHPGATLARMGQIGWIARGVAFGVLGVLIVVAGLRSQPEEARGLDAALKTLAGQPYGQWILTVVALGLACYAAFQLLTAPRRREG